ERVRTIASNLLTLEVNTVVKNGMVGQKMPEVPVALHEVVQQYSEFTRQCGVAVTPRLMMAAAGRLSDPDRSQSHLDDLRAWAKEAALADEPQLAAADALADEPLEILTNGAESFEAIVWTAV